MFLNAAWVTGCLGGAFACSELALSLRRRSLADAVRSDRGSLHVLWVVIVLAWMLAVFTARFCPAGQLRIGPMLLGGALALFAAGVALRWYAIVHLGRMFTVDVAIAKDHRLIDSGPYRRIRHPSYAGALLAFVGLGLTLGSLPALLALLIPCCAAYAYRIRVEEAALRRGLPQVYVAYARRTYRLIPGVY